MAQKSNIQWTDGTWNIGRGCRKVDADCLYCYMYRNATGLFKFDPKTPTRTKTVFDMPLKYKATKSECWDGLPLIFTSSLTDPLLPEFDSFRHEMWAIIRKRPDLIFQILTKRPERFPECLPEDWGEGYPNVWIGTSVGHNKAIDRIRKLCEVPAKVRFISFEPLWEDLDLTSVEWEIMEFINWAIIGGESGNDNGLYKYRPCEVEWMKGLAAEMDYCNVKVFVKQMGTYISKQMKMTDRHGGNIDEFPKELRRREFPENWR